MTNKPSNLPETDYPAAHSMDTEWFAVDANGCIAMFDSGEAGAVPEKFLQGQGHQYMFEDVLEGLGKNEQGYIELLSDPRHWFEQQPRHVNEWGMGALLEIVPGYEDELRSLESWEGVIMAYPRCRNVFFVNEVDEERLQQTKWVLRSQSISLVEILGIYSFSCDTYGPSAPYQRDFAPVAPMTIADVPKAMQEQLASVAFAKVQFNQLTALQPFEHTPSTTWQGAWLGTDGKVRDID